MTIEDRQLTFLALLEPHRNALWRFVRSMSRSTTEAEDLFGETVLQAWEGFHRLRDEQAFVSFVFTIASRLQKRQRWRSALFGTYDEEAAHETPHPDPLPDAQADVEYLRCCLLKLPAAVREAVVLFDVLGLSLEEVRTIQGGTLSGVKSRLKRGRERLASMLEADIEHVPSNVSAPRLTIARIPGPTP